MKSSMVRGLGLWSTGVIGFTTETPITAPAFIAWGPILLVIAIMLAVYFRKMGALNAGSSGQGNVLIPNETGGGEP